MEKEEIDSELSINPHVDPEDYGYDSPFDLRRIDISPWQSSVYGVTERMRDNEIDLYPEYQRSENIWPKATQSRLIESLLIGIPLPAFYFTDEIVQSSPYRKWQIVDGLQRLCSLRNFILGYKNESGNIDSLRLTGLEYAKELEGKAFSELPQRMQRTILEAQLTGFIVRSGTPEDVKFNIFKRLNTGGKPLRPAEIRNAMYQGGGVAAFIKELAESAEFCTATFNKVETARMGDREFVSRFIAFYVQRDIDAYKKMDSFVGDGLKKLASITAHDRDDIKNVFKESMSAINSALKARAFCQYDSTSGQWLDRINKALFEVLSVSVARLSPSARMRFSSSHEAIEEYQRLFSNREEGSLSFSVSTSTARKKSVIDRYRIVSEYLERLTGEKV